MGGETQQRAQSPGLVGPKPRPAAAEQKAAEETKAIEKAEDAANGTSAQDTDPGAPLAVRAVAVVRGKGVERKLADVVRDAVEDAVGEDGTIGSKALDRELVLIRQKLINQGYYLSRIRRIGPEGGTTAEGILPLQLQIGTVQEIEVAFKGKAPGEDGTYYSNKQIKERFAGVEAGDGFNYGKLYLALYGLNSHPDLKADVNVGVEKGAGEEGDATAKFALTVEEDIPLHGSIEVNNHAIEALDDWQVVGMLQYLNLTRADDVLTISPGMALNGDQWSVAANYTRPFDFWKGGHASIWAGYSDTDVDHMEAGDIHDIMYNANGWFAGGQMNFNLIDTPDHRLQFFAGLQYRYVDQGLTWLNTDLSAYQVGVLPVTVGLSYMNRSLDALGGRNFITLSGAYNTLEYGDRIRQIWLDAEAHYSLARAQYARIQPIWGRMTLDQGFDSQWTAFFRAEGQWSNQSLISHEQVLLGGANNLRGYRVNGYAGDRGIYGTLELRTPVWRDLVGGLFFDDSEDPDDWFDSVQFVAFVDYGVLDRERTRYQQSDTQCLLSAGVGARLQLTKYTALTLDGAFPLRDVDENKVDDDDFEIYCAIRAQF